MQRTCHLAWKDTWRDVVDADLNTRATELLREKLAEVNRSGFRYIVLEVVLRRAGDTRHRRDVYDRPSVAFASCSCE